jgi:hypothetical protein
MSKILRALHDRSAIDSFFGYQIIGKKWQGVPVLDANAQKKPLLTNVYYDPRDLLVVTRIE